MRTHPQRPVLFLRAPDTSAIAAQGKGAPAHGIPRRLRGGSGAHTPAAPPSPKALSGAGHGAFSSFLLCPLYCVFYCTLFFLKISEGRPLRPNLSAAPSAPHSPLPGSRLPFPPPPSSHALLPLPTPHLPLPTPAFPSPAPCSLSPPRTSPIPTPAFPTPALPRPAPLSPLPGFPLPTPHLPAPHPGLSHPRTPTPFSPPAHKKGARIVSDACALFSLCSKSRPMSRPFKRGAFPRA